MARPPPEQVSAGRSNALLSSTISTNHACSSNALEDELRRFWELEEVPSKIALSPEDCLCEAHFSKTHSRDNLGRYLVRLPFKKGPPIKIGSSRRRAEQSLATMSRRLREQPEKTYAYNAFLTEYAELGHMCPVLSGFEKNEQAVYIPHHAVTRESNTMTPLRVVFNASSLTSNGSSLNNHLYAGPKLQSEIASVIIKWRLHQYVYSADITKMYRQIRVDLRDVDYQRIIWQPNFTEASIDYQLLTVTYGMTCAPFIALRVLKQLAHDEGDRFPLARPVLTHNIYIDDILFGADNQTLARQTRD